MKDEHQSQQHGFPRDLLKARGGPGPSPDAGGGFPFSPSLPWRDVCGCTRDSRARWLLVGFGQEQDGAEPGGRGSEGRVPPWAPTPFSDATCSLEL